MLLGERNVIQQQAAILLEIPSYLKLTQSIDSGKRSRRTIIVL